MRLYLTMNVILILAHSPSFSGSFQLLHERGDHSQLEFYWPFQKQRKEIV